MRWRCGAEGCSVGVHEGTVWKPQLNDFVRRRTAAATDYEIARDLGLTADPPPPDGVPYVMVDFDDRSGALQMHTWDELEEI